MYLNNYILIALYVPLIVVIFILLTFKPKDNFFKTFQVLFGVLFLVSIVGLIKGVLVGINLGKDSQYINEDISKLSTFIFFIGMPYFIIALNKNVLRRIFLVFNYSAILYTLLVSLSLFLAGSAEDESVSIYPGNLFGATTMNLTIISAWAFYALSILYITKKKEFFLWSILCYIDIIGSLAKWNILAIIGFPVLLIVMFYYNNNATKKSRKKYVIISLIIVAVFFANINIVLTPFVKSQGYESVEEFLFKRVYGDPQGTTIALSEEQGIKDGARLAMWGDLLIRTKESPILGVGLGSRALDYIGLNIEDHNIFITHLSRYGIPIFICWLILTFILIKRLRRYILNDHFSRIIKIIFVIIYINFFFQASVGNIWGQILVALFIGISIGLVLFKHRELHERNNISFILVDQNKNE